MGSYERETYRAGGSASAMLQPLLDNQVSTGPISNWFVSLDICARLATRIRKV